LDAPEHIQSLLLQHLPENFLQKFLKQPPILTKLKQSE